MAARGVSTRPGNVRVRNDPYPSTPRGSQTLPVRVVPREYRDQDWQLDVHREYFWVRSHWLTLDSHVPRVRRRGLGVMALLPPNHAVV